jgi:hypothetical protein
MTFEYNRVLTLGKQEKLYYFISNYVPVNNLTSHFEGKQIQSIREQYSETIFGNLQRGIDMRLERTA